MAGANLAAGRIESHAVVDDLDGQTVGSPSQAKYHVFRAGVPQSVLERLVGDAQNRQIPIAAQTGIVLVNLEVDRYVMDAREHRDLFAQRALEPVTLELGRPKPEYQSTQLFECLPCELAQPF